MSRAQAPELSGQELAELSSGRLVTRPESRRRGHRQLMGGTSYQVIDLPPAAVFEALLDTPRYPKLLPEVSEARLVARSPGEHKVYLRQGSGLIQLEYYLDLTIDREAREVSFRLDEDRPHGLRAAFGLYSVRRYAGGRTLLVFGIMADIGDGLLRSLVRDSVHEWMLKVPWTIKRFLEGSGRSRYMDLEPSRADQPTVQALSSPVSSGSWAGVVPDGGDAQERLP